MVPKKGQNLCLPHKPHRKLLDPAPGTLILTACQIHAPIMGPVIVFAIQFRPKRLGMSGVKIFGKTLTDEQVKALQALAAEAGCDVQTIEVIESIGESGP